MAEEKIALFLHGFQDQPFDPKEKGMAITERLSKDGWKVFSLSYSEMISASQGLPGTIYVPGDCGFAFPTKEPLSYCTDRLSKKIDELGIKKIDVVIGHSMGGMVACDLAKRYRKYAIKAVIMLETPILGLPAWLLRIWRFVSQKRASFSWPSIQNMRDDSIFATELNKDWPKNICRYEIAGSLSVMLKKFYNIPKEIPIKVFPKVKHDGPTGLRTNPEVLEYIATLLEFLTIWGSL